MRTNRRHFNIAVHDADALGVRGELTPLARAMTLAFTGSVSATTGAALGSTNGGPGNLIREDLSDVYKLLAVTETPLISAAGSSGMDAVFGEWTEDTLAAPADGVEVVEGNAGARTATLVPLRLRNVCQINEKVPEVSGTAMAVDVAGVEDPMAWSVAKKIKELKREMERRACLGASLNFTGGTFAAGFMVQRTSGVAGKTRSLAHFLAFDAPADRGDGLGTAPNVLFLAGSAAGISETATATPPANIGACVVLTLAHINTVKQQNYVTGGSADTLIVSPNIKAAISGMFGKGAVATAFYQQSQVGKNELSTNVTLIETPFGDLKVVPNLFISDQTILGIDKENLDIGWLRKLGSTTLAKTGDTEAKLVNCEWALKPKAIRAHFAILGSKAS